MATERQIAANRLNAQKCTGPRTPEGKAISSQNAVKTGLDAKSEVLSRESRDVYEALVAEYHRQYTPAGPEERFLVNTLITAEWLSRRYRTASTAIWEEEFRNIGDDPMGRVFNNRSESFCRLQRCMTAVRRDFQDALKQLQAAQTKRRVAEPAVQVREVEVRKVALREHDQERPLAECGGPIPDSEPQPESPMAEFTPTTPNASLDIKPLSKELDSFLTRAASAAPTGSVLTAADLETKFQPPIAA